MVTPPPLRAAGSLLFTFAAVLVVARASGAGDAGPPGRDDRPAEPAWQTQKAERRSGFTVGTSLGVGLASIVGFPNDAKKINRARYYTVTGVSPGDLGSLWIGGALADWFTFGLGFTGGSLWAIGDNEANAGGFLFHLEGFPVFPLGGHLRDLGVMLDTGIGVATVRKQSAPDDKLVDGTGCSLVGGGVFYEAVRLWKVNLGPFLAGNYLWSATVRRPGIFLGLRTSLYTGP